MCLAIPGKIISVSEAGDAAFRTAKVSFGGISREVNLCLITDAKIDDYVLVHAGVAISKVDEEEAKVTFEYLKLIGEADVPGQQREERQSAGNNDSKGIS
ncbi:MAG: HypC/HybG/HupF family hydrogenase formation chaperone [Chitinophagales bacterium]|nr:HypC/HybG/HupF family hydrogenase formation chaperone [Chitinophagales bacterium]